MNLVKRLLTIFFLIIVIFSGSLAVSNKISAEYRVNPYWYRIIGGRPNTDVEVLDRIVESESRAYYSKLIIPRIHGLRDMELYNQLNKMFYEGIVHFDLEMESNTHHYLEQYELESSSEEELKFTTEVTYRVNYNSGGILSLTVLFMHYNDVNFVPRFMETVNVDLTTGRMIEFRDLFATEQEINILVDAINQQIAQNPSAYYISSVQASDLIQIQSFYISENKIVVYFDLNDIAPYSSGLPEFILELNKAVNELRELYE